MPEDKVIEFPRKRSPLGRPSSERAQQLRQIILDAAATLMLEHGYANTSVDSIAKFAGITKRTIYTRFESKENLLREVLTAAAHPVLRLKCAVASDGTLLDKLVSVGLDMNATLLNPDMQKWLRFAIHSVAQQPELVSFLHALIDQYLSLLEEVLASIFASEALVVHDLPTSAKIFATLIASPAHNLATFALDPGSAEEQAHFLRAAMEVFLAGCRTR